MWGRFDDDGSGRLSAPEIRAVMLDEALYCHFALSFPVHIGIPDNIINRGYKLA
jgi:hypothetical protein